MSSRFGGSGPVAILLAPVLSGKSYNGAVGGIMDFARIRTILILNSTTPDMHYTLVDKNRNVILSSHQTQKTMQPFIRGKGTLTCLEDKIAQWVPVLPPNTSTIELWGKSWYVAESSIGKLAEWTLILEQPVATS